MIEEIEFAAARSVRLISTAYIDEPAVAPLADTEEELEILHRLEARTSARLTVLPGEVDPAELLNESYGYGYTYINAAFCHAKPPGNRFNDEHRGCWYSGVGRRAAQTAETEVAYHMTGHLAAAGAKDELVSYRQLLASFACRFHDVRGEPDHVCLHPDPAVGYPAGQALAKSLRADGSNGLLYPSVRLAGGECIAVFRPAVIQNVRQGEQVSFAWDGKTLRKV